MAIDPDSFARLLGTLGNKMPPPLVLVPGLPKGGDGNGAPAPTPAHDDYATEERLAIQEESAEVSDHPGKPVPSLEEQAEEVLDHYGADWRRGVDDLRIIARNPVLASLVEKMGIDAAANPAMQPAPDMARPARVTCGSCARFQPGPQPLAIGACLASANGLPPAGSRGYEAAFPMAPRRCPEYAGSAS